MLDLVPLTVVDHPTHPATPATVHGARAALVISMTAMLGGMTTILAGSDATICLVAAGAGTVGTLVTAAVAASSRP